MHIADKLATFHMLNFFYPSKFAHFTLVTSMYDVLEILCKVIKIYCLYTCLKKLAPSFDKASHMYRLVPHLMLKRCLLVPSCFENVSDTSQSSWRNILSI